MEKRRARTFAGLVIALALASLFVVNQITSTEPTSVYTPGPRQPLTAPTPHSTRPHPHPSVSTALSQPRTVAPAPRPTPTRHTTRYGSRKPLRHHRPTHHPKPPSHHPRPPSHRPTPPPSSPPPPKDPGVLCRLLGICLKNLTHLGVSLHP